ncbi:IFN resistance, eIF2a-like PKR inhibitor [Eptesipox virus]|uniref:IFN resistance, eIF2a-like PKR inhibitor n=1 Tax=Eptesipox virus TaxID=1329402 RepID=A0A220T674_9POXV|nr:IFN resistance, eIF2a-like PKR inhibitor [Eptesipox virus]YP_009408131.1 IFN resistance, eIF2a-like PKR inhibitor [Eptesipox virus]ASK51213.1 IFN resistance, eIF2a-like PKR inhibitor [Eptesipox virus]ASK51381.1 IFN resistance, eIF2a-like PKR inhibitor [Eptesipox virus]
MASSDVKTEALPNIGDVVKGTVFVEDGFVYARMDKYNTTTLILNYCDINKQAFDKITTNLIGKSIYLQVKHVDYNKKYIDSVHIHKKKKKEKVNELEQIKQIKIQHLLQTGIGYITEAINNLQDSNKKNDTVNIIKTNCVDIDINKFKTFNTHKFIVGDMLFTFQQIEK